MEIAQFAFRMALAVVAGLTFWPSSAPAASPRLLVRPYGTNQLQLTASSLETNVNYLVMARTNSPDAHWLTLASISADSNSTATTFCDLHAAANQEGLRGLTLANLSHWTFVVGSGEDSDGNGLPDVYEELVTRSDPYSGADPYADPDGDGWSNLQEMQNGTNPLRFDRDPPPPSAFDVRQYTNGLVKLTWSYWSGGADYFQVEQAQRTLQPNTNPGPFMLQPPPRPNRTNLNAYVARQRALQQRYGPPFNQRYRPAFITGEFHPVAKVPAKPGQHDYSFAQTNVNASLLSQPVYRVQVHFTPPLHAHLDQVNAATIRRTLLTIRAQPATNGYDLVALSPIPYAYYLLLVRDRNDPQWRASGYFISGTNRDPVHLHTDAKGMMHEGQGPIVMPNVSFLPDVVAPEFTAGWGEDSDGDGLPDIYEVLVTETDPLNADTGNTGILDGYKEPAKDDWTNLEKFRRRVPPQKACPAPLPVELKQPTLADIWRAFNPLALKTDLHYQPQLLVRKAAETNFRPFDPDLKMSDYRAKLADPRNAHFDFDVRIVWRAPRPHPQPSGYSGP